MSDTAKDKKRKAGSVAERIDSKKMLCNGQQTNRMKICLEEF